MMFENSSAWCGGFRESSVNSEHGSWSCAVSVITLDRASATCEPRRLYCVAKFGNCRIGRLHVGGYAP